MEHTPVEVTSALLRAVFDQPVNLRVNGLHRQHRCKLRQTRDPLPADPRFEAVPSITDTHRAQPAVGSLEPAAQLQAGCAPANEGLIPGRSKRPPATEKEHGFEQTGLSRGIGSADQITTAVPFEVGRRDATEVTYLEAAQAQEAALERRPPGDGRCSTWNVTDGQSLDPKSTARAERWLAALAKGCPAPMSKPIQWAADLDRSSEVADLTAASA